MATDGPGQYLSLEPSPSGRFLMIQQRTLSAPHPDRDVLVDLSRDARIVFDWVPLGAVDDGWTDEDAWFSRHDAIGCNCGTTDVLSPAIGHLSGCVDIEQLREIHCKAAAHRFHVSHGGS